MTDQHRATPEQWDDVKNWAELACSDSSCLFELRARVEALEAPDGKALRDAILHLAETVKHLGHRVEALEAAQRPFAVIDTSQWSDDERQRAMEQLDQPGTFRVLTAEEMAPVVAPVSAPADSLVERVQSAIDNAPPDTYREARAAIREVAAWLESLPPSFLSQEELKEAAFLIRKEANR